MAQFLYFLAFYSPGSLQIPLDARLFDSDVDTNTYNGDKEHVKEFQSNGRVPRHVLVLDTYRRVLVQ